MKTITCSVCNANQADIIMKFTPELLSAVNPTYVLNNFKRAVKGKEDLLTYSQCRQLGSADFEIMGRCLYIISFPFAVSAPQMQVGQFFLRLESIGWFHGVFFHLLLSALQ